AGEEEAATGPKTVVIDKLLADRLFGNADPVGRPLLIQGREAGDSEPFFVAGVVAAGMRHDAFDIAPKPHVFLPTSALFRPSLTIHARTAPGLSETSVLGAIVRELKALDPAVPIFSASTMVDYRYRSLSEWAMRAAATMFSTFGLLALVLAAIGVYGLRA